MVRLQAPCNVPAAHTERHAGNSLQQLTLVSVGGAFSGSYRVAMVAPEVRDRDSMNWKKFQEVPRKASECIPVSLLSYCFSMTSCK